ncbi:MAG: hypothetical protein Q9168_003937 [Polycauliona sp. 1 TL-2023]
MSSRGPSFPCLIFTHGAGGTLASPAIANFSAGFLLHSTIVCFQGNSNLASRTKMFSAVIAQQRAPASLGGRSMGARAAVMAATEKTEFLILVSYPLHTGDQVRDQILLDIRPSVKVIFVSGDRDSMCDLARLDEVRSKMKCRTWRIVVEGADHGMDVKPKRLTAAVGARTGQAVAEWLNSHDYNRREARICCDEDGEVQWMGWAKAHGEVVHQSEAKPKNTASLNNSPELPVATKSKTASKSSANAKRTSRKAEVPTRGGENKKDANSKGVKRTADAVQDADVSHDGVSKRTRAATKARKLV